jgi:hypothetical protein
VVVFEGLPDDGVAALLQVDPADLLTLELQPEGAAPLQTLRQPVDLASG